MKYPAAFCLPLLLCMPLGHSHEEIDEVIITSRVEDREAGETVQPIRLLDKATLETLSGDTLGALLQNTPGVANAAFGQGVGRPVLRGLSGARIKVMMNGVSSADVSAMSSDHAAMVDPVNADEIEIIQGPATLFYGGGAIGGIVNVNKQRIHNETLTGISGELNTQFSTVDNGKLVTGITDIGLQNWVVHLEGFGRRTDDYLSGQHSPSEKVPNSDTKSYGGNIALSWIDNKKGFMGLSISQLRYDYAVPNPGNEDARITPDRLDVEIKSQLNLSASIINNWSNEISYSQYQHKELDDDKVDGLFNKDSWQAKSWIEHDDIKGIEGSLGIDLSYQSLDVCHDHSGCHDIPHWRQPWDGSKGKHLDYINGYEFSHDNPMPLTTTQDYGIFIIEEAPWSAGLFSLGARFDYRHISADPVSIRIASRQAAPYYNDKHFQTFNLNAAGTWAVTHQQKMGLSIARAQRAPEVEELFYNGDHHATFAYQLNNPDLKAETAYTVILNWSYSTQSIQSVLNAYYYHFDGFIYNALTGQRDPYHGNPVYRHEQRDADFMGSEIEINWQPLQQYPAFSFAFYADYVKARLTSGINRNLPRIPPASLGLESIYQTNSWYWQIALRTFAKQTDTAENETQTDGYTTLNMQVRYEKIVANQTYWASIKGNNLANTYGENAVSYLKRYAPITGRDFRFEVGVRF